jgi:arginyl-tRNA synthetase
MRPPVVVLTERLQSAIETVLGVEYRGADPVLRRSASPQFGDYQANAAMSLGKKVGRVPRDLAQSIVDALDVLDVCSSVEVAGPGFINLTLRDEALADAAQALVGDERLGVPLADPTQRVVVDYSAPNVAKEMHVGHLRSTIIGDALARVLGFRGHEVIRQNHLGDWGTQFGMLIEHLLDLGEEEAIHELSVGDLTAFYQGARVKFDSDPAFADRARSRVVLLQAGDEQTLRSWRLLFDASKGYFNAVYDRLHVLLTDDDIAAESFYNPWLAEVADELEAAGLARIDDGALCAFPEGFKNREGDPMALMIRKSDGGFGYQATDLAAVRYRVRDLGVDRIVYVVGAPQAQHLQMVHEVAREAGWIGRGHSDGRPSAEHVPFGSILGEDRKMYKTRSGDSVKLSDLLDEAVERALAKVRDTNPDLPPDEQQRVAAAIGIGAIKYADLSNDRVKDYVFDWDRMLAFEGNTGPYLQYAHARIRSIFRRAEVSPSSLPASALAIGEPAERALVLELLGLPEVVEAVDETLQPHRLCTYAFEVAQAFTTFYEQCPVLRAPDEATRASRLLLCDVTARTIALCLSLLGIEAPDRM